MPDYFLSQYHMVYAFFLYFSFVHIAATPYAIGTAKHNSTQLVISAQVYEEILLKVNSFINVPSTSAGIKRSFSSFASTVCVLSGIACSFASTKPKTISEKR